VVGRDNYLKEAYPPCDLGRKQANQMRTTHPLVYLSTGYKPGSRPSKCTLTTIGLNNRAHASPRRKDKILSPLSQTRSYYKPSGKQFITSCHLSLPIHVFNRTNMADQSWGTGSRPEETGRRPENAKSHQPEGAGRYLPEGAKTQAETYFPKTAETYFPEEAGGRILINPLTIRQRPIT
jgi:hypothetical protein